MIETFTLQQKARERKIIDGTLSHRELVDRTATRSYNDCCIEVLEVN